jgi:aspartyl protease family protein
MNMEDGGSIVYAAGALILLVSALAARRLPIATMAKMILAWAAVFAVLFVVISYRFEIKQMWSHVKSDLSGTGSQDTSGKNVRLKRGDDGHFSAVVDVDGTPVTFLIDTGATVTSMSAKAAKSAKISVDRSTYPVIVETANGAVRDWRAVAQRITIGSIVLTDHTVLVSDNLSDDQNLLGMNFLNELRSWSVEGDYMILVP